MVKLILLILGVNGPWGGKFKIAEKAHKLNVLNLFKHVMELPAAKEESSDEDDY